MIATIYEKGQLNERFYAWSSIQGYENAHLYIITVVIDYMVATIPALKYIVGM